MPLLAGRAQRAVAEADVEARGGECSRASFTCPASLLITVARADRCTIMAPPSTDTDDLFRLVCVRGPLSADGVHQLIDVVESYAIEGFMVELDLSGVTGLDVFARSALCALIDRAQAQAWPVYLTAPGARSARSPAPPAGADRTQDAAA